ncbi:MAG: metal ABC transporter substrate-binding protein [Atopobiaceae bacterium]|nr:metal ABC transporter substrate-binding protein [Atopobiaceae bacterium]
MKRIAAALAACALSLGMLAACGQGAPAPQGSASEDKIEIVCTTFPGYDWVRQVVGDRADRVEITYLADSGVDLHSFQPTVEDVAQIGSCDLFVYVGGESDEWVEDVLAHAENPQIRTVCMLDAVGDAAVEEELVEGMQAEDEHDHEGEEEEHDHEEEGPEYDEHVWLSLKNAQIIVDAIAGELAVIDGDGAAVYVQNAAAYNAQLADLDSRYADAIAGAANSTMLFADRFPFRYLADDYGLAYYAAFVGCSAETEASFETVAFLAQKLDELGLGTVLVIESSDQAIARTVIASTAAQNQQILVMDSLQSTTSAEIEAGKTYLSAMEDNLAVLTTALG